MAVDKVYVKVSGHEMQRSGKRPNEPVAGGHLVVPYRETDGGVRPPLSHTPATIVCACRSLARSSPLSCWPCFSTAPDSIWRLAGDEPLALSKVNVKFMYC